MTLIDISTNFKIHDAKILGKFDKTDYSNTEMFMAKKKKKVINQEKISVLNTTE